jgi:hypothetical protein
MFSKELSLALPSSLVLAALAFAPACADDDDESMDTNTTATGTSSGTTSGTTLTGTDTATGTETGTTTTPPNCAELTGPRENLPATNDGNKTLTCDKVWVLTEHTFWNSGTLTIEPGTKIIGLKGSSLIINKGANLQAIGTETAPIVMTSSNLATGGVAASGDWGGLVLVGDAPANIGIGLVEGYPNPFMYGGSNPAYSCGTLKYLRIEYAGAELSAGSEINGITFYACGTETKVDHIQVHRGSDDGIEFFGGGFNLDHVVLTGNEDDSLDIDQGFQGKLQYVLIQHAPGLGNYGLEWSNQANDFTAAPLTHPMLANATIIGSDGATSMGWTNKEGNQADVYCSIFTNFQHETLYLTNIETQNQLQSVPPAINLMNSLFFANAAPLAKTCLEVKPAECDVTMTGADLEAWARDAAKGNHFDVDPQLTNIGWGTVDPKPAATSPVAGKCTVPAGFEPATYIGAVDPAATVAWTSAPWITR